MIVLILLFIKKLEDIGLKTHYFFLMKNYPIDYKLK